MRGDGLKHNEKPFPLDIVRLGDGYGIIVFLENGERWRLMKPGWQEDQTSPYVFATAAQAWGFLRDMFLFCLKQRHTQYAASDKIINCDYCGKVFRPRFFSYCPQCLQQNENVLQQVWQGFYHMTGSQDATLHKVALLLKISSDEFVNVPDAFNQMVKNHLQYYLTLDKDALALERTAPTRKPATPAKPPARLSSGMHYTRRV